MLAALISFILLFFFILFLATLFHQLTPLRSFSYTLIFIYSVIINTLSIADFLEIGFLWFGLIPIIGLALLKSRKRYLDSQSHIFWGRTTKVLFTWLISFALVTIPYFFLTDNALIPGHFISNDSVIHAILAKGFEETRELDIPEFYNSSYPRGYHSLIYYVAKIIKEDTFNLLLISAIFGYSFTSIAIKPILDNLKIKSPLCWIVALIPSVCFLPVVSVYHLFIPQVVVIPFVITASYFSKELLKFDRKGYPFFLMMWISICAAALNIYGVFALSLIMFVALLQNLYIFLAGKLKINFIFSEIKKRIHILAGLFIYSLLIMTPSLYLSYNILTLQMSSSIGSDLLSSPGNLGGIGFLSPMHLTGIWFPSLGYRDQLAGANSQYAYISLLLLLTLAWGVFRTWKNSQSVIILLCAFSIPVFMSATFFPNPYIQFKYLTFFIPLFVSIGFVGLITLFNKGVVKTFVSISILILLLTYSLKAYSIIPVVRDSQLQELKILDKTYLEKGETLFLTKEDWIQYFRDDHDDYIPLTQYTPYAYNNQTLNYVIIDEAYIIDAEEYIENSPIVKEQILSEKTCIKKEFSRYTVYKLNCKN